MYVELKNNQVTRTRRSIYLMNHLRKDGRAKEDLNRILQSRPEFTLPLYHRSVYVGDSIVFTITATVHPTPDVIWYHRGEKVDPTKADSRYVVTKEKGLYSMEITKCVIQDNGEVKVVARNLHGEDECKANLIVQSRAKIADVNVAPMFRRLLCSQEIEEGDTACFELGVSGEPKPKVQWTKNGKPLQNDYRHEIIWKDGNICYLLIRDVFEQDTGEYKATATNAAGTVCSQAHLKVNAHVYERKKRKTDVVEVVSTKSIALRLPKEKKEDRLDARRKELNMRMPYTMPEPVVHSSKSLKLDKSIEKFKPMSEMSWYKAVQDSNDLVITSDVDFSRSEPPKRMKRYKPFVPEQFYVVPEKRVATTSTKIMKHRAVGDIVDDKKKIEKKSVSPAPSSVASFTSDRELLQPAKSYLIEKST
jgi:titin